MHSPSRISTFGKKATWLDFDFTRFADRQLERLRSRDGDALGVALLDPFDRLSNRIDDQIGANALLAIQRLFKPSIVRLSRHHSINWRDKEAHRVQGNPVTRSVASEGDGLTAAENVLPIALEDKGRALSHKA